MGIATKRVLFVEPEEASRKIYSKVLKPEENGWELSFAPTGAEALELIWDNPFDIVICVNKLPDLLGTELLENLRETAPQTIRFLLIDETEKKTFRSLVSSAQQILIKPIELKPFITQINRALALRKLVKDPTILKLVGGEEVLPPLPSVFQELTRKLNDPTTCLNDVAELIAKDIVLSSKILKMANSALFGLREPAKNVTHAVSLLGTSAVSTLVFSEGAYNTFKDNSKNNAYFEELNRHSIECAALASRILTHWRASREMIEKSIFCGVAHDLGKLVLAKYAPDKWARVLEEIRKSNRLDVEVEREIIGISHTELTAYLLAVWGFPNDQIIAMAFHHEPSRIEEKEFGLLCALHIAENLTEKKPLCGHFDDKYLEENRITQTDINNFKIIYNEECRF